MGEQRIPDGRTRETLQAALQTAKSMARGTHYETLFGYWSACTLCHGYGLKRYPVQHEADCPVVQARAVVHKIEDELRRARPARAEGNVDG